MYLLVDVGPFVVEQPSVQCALQGVGILIIYLFSIYLFHKALQGQLLNITRISR